MTLYDFYADWCGPCKAMNPVIDMLHNDYPEINIVKINIDEQPELATEYSVSSIPTLVLMDNDEERARVTGAMPKYRLYESLGLSS